jgi:hypothetical protein
MKFPFLPEFSPRSKRVGLPLQGLNNKLDILSIKQRK